jgi:hypothetical protein
VGVLNSVTAEEQARALVGGRDTSFVVEPLTNYTVARVSRDFRNGSSAIGAIATATYRRIEAGSELDFLRSFGYVGGLDGRHRSSDGRYEFRGAVYGSQVGGSTRAIEATQKSAARYFQRPDAGHVQLDPSRTRLGGLAAVASFSKISGGNWRTHTLTTMRSPGFEANDVGFLRVADAASTIGGVRYVQTKPGARLRNWSLGSDLGSSWTFGGERFLTAAVLQGDVQFANFWTTNGFVARLLPALSTTALRGGPAIFSPASTFGMIQVGTDGRKPLRLNLSAEVQREDQTGAGSHTVGTTFTARPSRQMSVSIEPRYSGHNSAWHYLRNQNVAGETRYVGGRLDQRTFSLTTRVDYTFAPDVSLQFYAQPFVSAGDFSDLREVSDPRATGFDERFSPLPAARADFNEDFSEHAFRAITVLRWEYRPASTIFLVWSQGRGHTSEDGSFAIRRDLGRLFGLEQGATETPTNILLLKVSYWFDR